MRLKQDLKCEQQRGVVLLFEEIHESFYTKRKDIGDTDQTDHMRSKCKWHVEVIKEWSINN